MSSDWSEQSEVENVAASLIEEDFEKKHQRNGCISDHQLTSTPLRYWSTSDGFSFTEDEEAFGPSPCSSIPDLVELKELKGMPDDLDSEHSETNIDSSFVDGFSDIGSWKSADDWNSEADRSYLKELDVESASGNIAESLCKILMLCPNECVLLQAMTFANASNMLEFAHKVQEKLNLFIADNHNRLAKNLSKSSLRWRQELDRAKAILSSPSPHVNDDEALELQSKDFLQDINSNDSSFGHV